MAATFITSSAIAQQPPTPPEIANASIEPMKGLVVSYRSTLYDDLQNFALCATDTSDKPKPLIVDLIPGTYGRMEAAARECQTICNIAKQNGLDCVAMRPGGRGNGSLFQGYGEVDVYEAINAVRGKLAIDVERISVTGASMGGAATWYHASHYPDFWAAAAPFCGYCDHRLWDKPGGYTFPLEEWEEFSWNSRNAADRVPNLRSVALRIVHGEWDRAVGGGVPVEHSRQMDRKLTQLNFPHTYIELPATGHGARTTEQWQQTIPWLLQQRRVNEPDQVSLIVHTLRHNRAHWIEVEQQSRYGTASTIAARFDRSNKSVRVDTTNVQRLVIGPLNDAGAVTLRLDGVSISALDLSKPRRFLRESSRRWVETAEPIPPAQKQPELSGPFGDLFIGPTVIVYGESGSAASSNFNRMMADNVDDQFRHTNGGLHRGGIMGDNDVYMPILSDRQFRQTISKISATQPGAAPIASAPASQPAASAGTKTDSRINADLLQRANLLLIGDPTSNVILADLAPAMKLGVEAGAIELGGRKFIGEHPACLAVLPHPDGNRYVAVLAGVEPDAITWASHLSLQLLPDYFIFDHARVLEWGFFDNDWRAAGR